MLQRFWILRIIFLDQRTSHSHSVCLFFFPKQQAMFIHWFYNNFKCRITLLRSAAALHVIFLIMIFSLIQPPFYIEKPGAYRYNNKRFQNQTLWEGWLKSKREYFRLVLSVSVLWLLHHSNNRMSPPWLSAIQSFCTLVSSLSAGKEPAGGTRPWRRQFEVENPIDKLFFFFYFLKKITKYRETYLLLDTK